MLSDLRPATKLGFGLMRLPLLEDKSVDISQVCAMVDAFIEKGFTYFDTAYGYLGGTSEPAAKAALVDRYPRESYTLATKLPSWKLECKEDVQRVFDDQLKRTGAGYFDYYLLHAVSASSLSIYDGYDCWNWAQEMKAKGLIHHVGFSFHDTAEVLDKILTDHPEVEFVQLQINYLDWEDDNVQSRLCYEVACKHGKPVIVMEPVKGGTLARLPERAAKLLTEANPDVSQASWGIRFCASLENVMMVLSGMSDTVQMEDNLRTMADFKPLTNEEQQVVMAVREAVLSVPTVPCTACSYCVEGCPMNIQIPAVIRCLNNVRRYELSPKFVEQYKNAAQQGSPASACISCGQCEGVCPQHIPVIEVMKEAAQVFEAE